MKQAELVRDADPTSYLTKDNRRMLNLSAIPKNFL
jgi:hypothetical protein